MPAVSPDSCGDGPACEGERSCVEYYPVSDRPGPAEHSCEQVCSYAGEDCPTGQYCAMESAGAGFVCRPVLADEVPADIERVIELAEIWSRVRFVHPWLAYRDIDWGAALREAIPAARSAQTDEAFRGAVGQMLAVLGDPATHVIDPDPDAPLPEASVREEEGVLLVSFPPHAFRDRALRQQIAEQVVAAERIVFDIRGWPLAFLEMLDAAFAEWTPGLLESSPLTLPASRRRVMHGFAPDRGFSSGGYYGAFETPEVSRVHGQRARAARIAFVVGESQVLPSIAVPLLDSGHSLVVSEQDLHGWGLGTSTLGPVAGSYYEMRIGEPSVGGRRPLVKAAAVTTEEPVARARALLFRARSRARSRRGPLRPRSLSWEPLPSPIHTVPSSTEPDVLPGVEARMQAAIDLWSTIRHFHAYPELRPRWDGALARALSAMDGADTWPAYLRVMMTLNASVDDGHSRMTSDHISAMLGPAGAPFEFAVVQGCLVVTAVIFPKLAGTLEVGDAIAQIDGVSFSERFGQLAPLIASSTPGAHRHVVADFVLSGVEDEPARLIVDRGGQRHEVTIRWTTQEPPRSEEPAWWRVADDTIGVVDLRRLTTPEVAPMFADLQDTQAIVFDLRGYPKGTGWAIAPYLDEHPGPTVAARIEQPLLTSSIRDPNAVGQRTLFTQVLPERAVEHYGGATIMLTDGRTISQAEHTGLFFEAANGTRFVGTPSAGANGDVTYRLLPDGSKVMLTGQAIAPPGPRPLQRVGLPLALEVAPTIAGVRSGRDEVLDAAIELLSSQGN